MFGLGGKRDPKKIFGPFQDGTGAAVYGDPAELHARLVCKLDGNPEKVVQDTKSPNAEIAYAAMQQWLDAVAFAFEVKRFDKATATGLQREDLVSLGNSFADWLKKNGQTPADSPTSSSHSTFSPGQSPTPISSGCGCN